MEVLVDPLWVEIYRIRPASPPIVDYLVKPKRFNLFKIDVADFHLAEFRLLYLAVILIMPVYT